MKITNILAAAMLASSLLLSSAIADEVPQHRTSRAAEVLDEALVRRLPGFSNAEATVNGVRLHYVVGGTGPLLVMLPGWPETWWEWHKIMPQLARSHRVVAVDIRGMGTSEKPAGGYDKKTMAADIAELIRKLGAGKATVVGHDIGSMVAYALAANRPELVEKLVLVDVAPPEQSLATWPMLPGIGTFGDKVGDGSHSYVWWFAFHQVKGLPEKLLADGRIRLEQDWMFHYLTRDDSSIDAFDRDVYQAAYTSADAIRAGDAWYQAFPQDIADNTGVPVLQMPVLAIGGPGFDWLRNVLTPRTSSLKLVKVDSGHFVPEERPEVLLAELAAFLR